MASDCEGMALLGIEEHAPGRGDQPETSADQHETQNMKRPKVQFPLPAEYHLEQMSGVVREPVDAGIPRLQPTREEIDAQRKAVHLREQRDQECAERAERAPGAACARLEKTVGEQAEDNGVDDDFLLRSPALTRNAGRRN